MEEGELSVELSGFFFVEFFLCPDDEGRLRMEEGWLCL